MISATALAGVPDFVRHAYGDRVLERASRAAMLDVEAIEDRDCYIPHVTMTTFAEAVARLAGEEYFGLILAPHLSLESYGCWGAYVLGAASLGAAVERAVATIAFHCRGDTIALHVADGTARLTYGSAARGRTGYVQVAIAAAGVLTSFCRAYLSAHWHPARVALDIPKPRRTSAFEDVFGCAVVFDAPTIAVTFDAQLLETPHAPSRPAKLVTVDDLVRQRIDCGTLGGFRDVLCEQIWAQLLSGHVSIESAARSLGTSVRTLQRELNREGTDFRSLTNAVRGRRARELLRHSDAPIGEISASLGYAVPAHFARAFRKMSGLGPGEYRRVARGGR